MDFHRTSNYMIGTMCGGESPYKNEQQQQQLIDQGLIPNPLYHSQHSVSQHSPNGDRLYVQHPAQQQQQVPQQTQICGATSMARPLTAVSPGCGIATYASLTNGNGGTAAGTGLHPPNRHSNGINRSLQSLALVMDDSPMNAARRLIGDPVIIRPTTQQAVTTNRDLQHCSKAQEGKLPAESGHMYAAHRDDKPLELTTNTHVSSTAAAAAATTATAATGISMPQASTESIPVPTSEQQHGGVISSQRQSNGRRISQEEIAPAAGPGMGSRGHISNGRLSSSPSTPVALRPSVKRCASDDWDDDGNKDDLKRTVLKDGRSLELTGTVDKSPEAVTAVNEASDPVLSATPPQPKKRGRRKKSEVIAAEMARRAELGLIIGGNRGLREGRMNEVIGSAIEDVRRAGREKKPYDPWANRKASGRPFVQDGPCFALLDVTSKKFPKCSACRVNDEVSECRFSEFRKLRFVGDLVQVDGFTDSDDAKDSDRRIWMTTDLKSDGPDVPSAGSPESAVPGQDGEQREPPLLGAAINRLDEKTAIMVLTNVGDIMCDLVREEAKVKSDYIDWMPAETTNGGQPTKVKWRRVYGVREMCDVCSTTIFNLHWTCGQCGFVACIDCFRARARRDEAINQEREDGVSPADRQSSNGSTTIGHRLGTNGREHWTTRRSREQHQPYSDKDEFRWLYCGNPKIQRSHSPRKLLMTQIVPGDILERVNRQQHEVRRRRGILMRCGCDDGGEHPRPDSEQTNGVPQSTKRPEDGGSSSKPALTKPALRLEARTRLKKLMAPAGNGLSFKRLLSIEMARMTGRKSNERPSCLSAMAVQTSSGSGLASSAAGAEAMARVAQGGDLADLRVLADIATQRSSLGPGLKVEGSSSGDSNAATDSTTNKDGFSRIHDIASAVLEARLNPDQRRPLCRLPVSANRLESLAPRVGQKSEGRRMYAAPHEWLCNGKLLLLLEATHPHNLELFQEQWNRGQPVVVAHVSEVLDMNLWRPDAFLRDFGEQKSTLVDCKTGADLGKPIPMKRFWEGFECFGKRMCDKNGDHMLLKLKDWPPDENFSEVLPTRYEDLMRALPLPMYTLREGSLNLANRLPDCFVPPDLGPKMYNAYGSALFPTKGTTNLHLDMSDAANVMVYVGIPRDGNCQRHIEEALRAVEEAGCDATQMKRVREKGAKVGAVWHIFHAQDADKIRELLKQVTVERGQRLEANSDPIHDQLWYLDRELRRRLLLEKGVRGYAIAQCVGDAVFIPAGAPHQVRNLHSCIKVAEDFVSPENLAHCLRLTNEFRFLSDTHTNHEDKLQIKNVVYHAVKDAVSVLDEGDRPRAEGC